MTTNLATFTQMRLFVGREREIQILEEAYHRVSRGAVEAIVVEGVSGVGKSKLIAKFLSEIDTDREQKAVFRSRCHENESAPFKAFDGIIDSIIHRLRSVPEEKIQEYLPPNISLLLHLFPSLRRVETIAHLPYRDIELEDAIELQKRSIDVFKDLLHRLAKDDPLVVVIDDMQWADADSLTIVKQLVVSSSVKKKEERKKEDE